MKTRRIANDNLLKGNLSMLIKVVY